MLRARRPKVVGPWRSVRDSQSWSVAEKVRRTGSIPGTRSLMVMLSIQRCGIRPSRPGLTALAPRPARHSDMRGSSCGRGPDAGRAPRSSTPGDVEHARPVFLPREHPSPRTGRTLSTRRLSTTGWLQPDTPNKIARRVRKQPEQVCPASRSRPGRFKYPHQPSPRCRPYSASPPRPNGSAMLVPACATSEPADSATSSPWHRVAHGRTG